MTPIQQEEQVGSCDDCDGGHVDCSRPGNCRREERDSMAPQCPRAGNGCDYEDLALC